MYVQVVFFIILTGAVHVSSLECNQEQNHAGSVLHRLRDKLMCNYDKNFVPVANQSETLNITLSVNLMSFFVHERLGSSLHASNKLVLSWMDMYLKWNPEDYESINEIEMNTGDIWSPNFTPVEFEFISSASSVLEMRECKVKSSGNVTCIVINSHYGFCTNDISEWPHGIYTCGIRYDSISLHGESYEFQLTNDGMVNVMPDASPSWKIRNQTTTLWHSGMAKDIRVHEIMFIFELEHIRTGYTNIYVIPAIVLSVMMLASYWVSTKKNDRLVIIAVNLVAHSFQMDLVKWNTSQLSTPYIVVFYRNSFILVAIGLLETVILRRIISSDKATPRWMITLDKITDQRVIRHLLLLDLLEIRQSVDEGNGSIVKEVKFFDQNNQMEKNQSSQIVDRFCFVISFLVYLVLIIILLMH